MSSKQAKKIRKYVKTHYTKWPDVSYELVKTTSATNQPRTILKLADCQRKVIQQFKKTGLPITIKV